MDKPEVTPTKKDYLADIAQSLEAIERILHDIRNAVEKDDS